MSDPDPEAIPPVSAASPVGAVFGGKKVHAWNQEGAVRVKKSFFSTLKLELDLRKSRGTKLDTQGLMFEWMEVFIQSAAILPVRCMFKIKRRLHSNLNY